jgi:hypothetical protein
MATGPQQLEKRIGKLERRVDELVELVVWLVNERREERLQAEEIARQFKLKPGQSG